MTLYRRRGVFEAYQLPARGAPVPPSFFDWCDRVGFNNWTSEKNESLAINGPYAKLKVSPGNWIVKITSDSFVPYGPDEFHSKYEPVTDPALYPMKTLMEVLKEERAAGYRECAESLRKSSNPDLKRWYTAVSDAVHATQYLKLGNTTAKLKELLSYLSEDFSPFASCPTSSECKHNGACMYGCKIVIKTAPDCGEAGHPDACGNAQCIRAVTEDRKVKQSPLHSPTTGNPITYVDILGAAARGWCYSKNIKKEMDTDLVLAVANEIANLFGVEIGSPGNKEKEPDAKRMQVIADDLLAFGLLLHSGKKG